MSEELHRRCSRIKTLGVVVLGTASLVFAGCGDDGGYGDPPGYPAPPAPAPAPPPPAPSYSVSVTVVGLSGSGLQLMNGIDTLAVATNGPSTFPTKGLTGSNFAVTVLSQPAVPAQTCEVVQGTGTIANADVTDIAVRCSVSGAPRFAYALNFADDSISIYNVDAATGQLRTRGYAKTGAGPQSAAHDAAGKFSFVLNSGIDQDPQTQLVLPSISVFARDEVNGDLQEVAGSPFVTAYSFAGAGALTVHPSGKFVYVTTLDRVIFQWAVGPDGALTAINDDFVESGASPRQLVFDARGRFAYLTHVDHESDGIRVYEVEPMTGALREKVALRVQFPSRELRTSNLAFHPAGKYVYVVNQTFNPGPGSLAAFSVDATTGALTPVPGQPVELPVEAFGAPIFDASGRFAYALSLGTPNKRGSIAGFSVERATGALTPLAGSPYESDFASASLSLTPSGDFLFVANHGARDLVYPPGPGSISAFKVHRGTGVLTRISGVDTVEPTPFNASIDPSGRYLYAPAVLGDRIHAYSIDAAGALKPLAQGAVIRSGREPISIQALVSPTVPGPAVFVPKSVYMADPPAREVTSFNVDATSGLLQQIGSIPSPGLSPRALAPSVDGKFLHSAELAGSSTTFAIDAMNGTLTTIDGGTIAAGRGPVAIVTDPSNRFVYVANHDDATVTAYRREQKSGKLTAIGDPVTIVSRPISMAIDPTGRNIYVMSLSQVQVFGIDNVTGALRIAATADRGVTDLVNGVAAQVAIEPGGKVLYVVGFLGSIEIYRIDPLTGALGSGSTKRTDPGSLSIAIDPTGRFLYTGGSASRSISVFTIAQRNGALTELERVMLPADPLQVLADFSGKYLWALQFDNSVASFAIDQDSGALSSIANLPLRAPGATHLATVGVVQ
jgi:6-phosphogluconolactonase